MVNEVHGQLILNVLETISKTSDLFDQFISIYKSLLDWSFFQVGYKIAVKYLNTQVSH